MLIELLQNEDELTETEQELARYILEHLDTVTDMTVRQLADAAFVSPPMVSRLCRKLGTKGWNDFKVRLAAECTESYQLMMGVDSNFPFGEEDSPREIADKLAQLSMQHILSAKDNLDIATIHRASEVISRKKAIDIYGEGTSLAAASEFVEKMLLIGYPAYLIENMTRQHYQAIVASEERFAIFISHSGLLTTLQKLIRLLHERRVPVLLITGNPHSPMVRYADFVCYIHTKEELDMANKIGRFGVPTVIHYILDVLYACVFSNGYRKHWRMLHKLDRDFFQLRD